MIVKAVIYLWWFYGDFLIILTIYIKFKFDNFTDSIIAIAEDIFPFFSAMFATNMCLQKVKRF